MLQVPLAKGKAKAKMESAKVVMKVRVKVAKHRLYARGLPPNVQVVLARSYMSPSLKPSNVQMASRWSASPTKK